MQKSKVSLEEMQVGDMALIDFSTVNTKNEPFWCKAVTKEKQFNDSYVVIFEILNDKNFPRQVQYCERHHSKITLGFKGWRKVLNTMTKEQFKEFVDIDISHTIVDEDTLIQLQKALGLPVTMSDFDNSNSHLIADHDMYYEAQEDTLESSKEHAKIFLQFLQRKGVDVKSLIEE